MQDVRFYCADCNILLSICPIRDEELKKYLIASAKSHLIECYKRLYGVGSQLDESMSHLWAGKLQNLGAQRPRCVQAAAVELLLSSELDSAEYLRCIDQLMKCYLMPNIYSNALLKSYVGNIRAHILALMNDCELPNQTLQSIAMVCFHSMGLLYLGGVPDYDQRLEMVREQYIPDIRIDVKITTCIGCGVSYKDHMAPFEAIVCTNPSDLQYSPMMVCDSTESCSSEVYLDTPKPVDRIADYTPRSNTSRLGKALKIVYKSDIAQAMPDSTTPMDWALDPRLYPSLPWREGSNEEVTLDEEQDGERQDSPSANAIWVNLLEGLKNCQVSDDDSQSLEGPWELSIEIEDDMSLTNPLKDLMVELRKIEVSQTDRSARRQAEEHTAINNHTPHADSIVAETPMVADKGVDCTRNTTDRGDTIREGMRDSDEGKALYESTLPNKRRRIATSQDDLPLKNDRTDDPLYKFADAKRVVQELNVKLSELARSTLERQLLDSGSQLGSWEPSHSVSNYPTPGRYIEDTNMAYAMDVAKKNSPEKMVNMNTGELLARAVNPKDKGGAAVKRPIENPGKMSFKDKRILRRKPNPKTTSKLSPLTISAIQDLENQIPALRVNRHSRFNPYSDSGPKTSQYPDKEAVLIEHQESLEKTPSPGVSSRSMLSSPNIDDETLYVSVMNDYDSAENIRLKRGSTPTNAPTDSPQSPYMEGAEYRLRPLLSRQVPNQLAEPSTHRTSTSSTNKVRRVNRSWSFHEMEELRRLINETGSTSWSLILSISNLLQETGRTQGDIKDKWRSLKKKMKLDENGYWQWNA